MPGKTRDGYNANVTTQDKADNAKADLMNSADIISRDKMNGVGDYSVKSRSVNNIPMSDYDHNMTHRPPVIGPSDYED